MKRLVLFLLACSVCALAQVEHSGLTIPGDGAVQVVRSVGAVAPSNPASIESMFPDGIVFSGYSTGYDFATAATAILDDRSPYDNDLSQTVEDRKLLRAFTNGIPTMDNTNSYKFLVGNLVGLASTTVTIAWACQAEANPATTDYYGWALGADGTWTANSYLAWQYGTQAGTSVDRFDIDSVARGPIVQETGLMTESSTDINTFVVAVDGATATYYASGTYQPSPAQVAAYNISFANNSFSIGGFSFYPSTLQGAAWASIHVWNRKLSQAEMAAVYAQMKLIQQAMKAGVIY